MTASADDYLVTIKMRVRVTDRAGLLQALQERDPRTANALSDEPELALSLAVQDLVRPPALTGIPGLAPPADGLWASVKAELWPGGDVL